MRNYSKLSPFFWLKGSGKRLRGDAIAQVVASYLSTSPAANMCGIYFLALATIAAETGHALADVRAALERISRAGYAHYDVEAELVWIPNHAFFEVGESMKPLDKRRPKLMSELAQVDGHRFVEEFRKRYGSAYGISANDLPSSSPPPSMPLPSKPEGASGDEGPSQDNHRTGQEQDKGPSGPAPPAVPRRVSTGSASGMGVRDTYQAAVVAATGKAYALGRGAWHWQSLCDLVNTHGAEVPDVNAWLTSLVAEWVAACDGKSPSGWEPQALMRWVQGGKPKSITFVRGKGGGPRGDRQGLPAGHIPWLPTGTDPDPFGDDS